MFMASNPSSFISVGLAIVPELDQLEQNLFSLVFQFFYGHSANYYSPVKGI